MRPIIIGNARGFHYHYLARMTARLPRHRGVARGMDDVYERT